MHISAVLSPFSPLHRDQDDGRAGVRAGPKRARGSASYRKMFKPKEESSHEEADPDVAGRRHGGHGVLGACRGQGGHEQEADGGFPPDRRKPAVAHRRVRLVQERGRQLQHRPEVRERGGQPGQPDQGPPLIHRPRRRRHHPSPPGRDGLGSGPQGGQGRQDPGHPGGPRHQDQRPLPLRDPARLRLRLRG